jgi:NAD(P)-dependent dehydrogenase (short-subunit alcohol dehydrogenase family)
MTGGNGRVALVTGASRGIGRAIALGLAERGFDLALNDIPRQAESLDEVAAKARETGHRVLTVHADVSVKAEVTAMVERFVAEFGTIHAAVNNAGILIASAVEALAEDHWDSVMDVNAKGTFLVTQAVLPLMKAQHYGRICNIASIGGKHGAPEQAHYSASKAAVMGFTRVLAQEVGPLGITANCVCPGIILTDMGSHLLDTARFLFGEAQSLYCRTAKVHKDIRGEDVATVMMSIDLSSITLRIRSSGMSSPPPATGVAAPMFVPGAITATLLAIVMKVPALAALAPGGATHTIVGSGASSSVPTIWRVESSAPPGVFRRITTASAPSRWALAMPSRR